LNHTPMTTPIIAIDPGLRGGIALSGIALNNTIGVEACAMPDTEGDILGEFSDIVTACRREGFEPVAYLELVPAGMPNRGAAMVKLNANAAFIRGALMALKVRMILVRPVEWQEYFNLGKRRDCANDYQWKKKLRGEAQRRFPQIKVTDETADALLILEWAKTQQN
jgi:hypothetical protein